MLISIYNRKSDKWEVKDFDTLTEGEKKYFEDNYPVPSGWLEIDRRELQEPFKSMQANNVSRETEISDEEKRRIELRFKKMLIDITPEKMETFRDKLEALKSKSNFTIEFLAKQDTDINVNMVIWALKAGQTPYQIIEQLVQQLDNTQKEYTKLLMHAGSLER